MPKPAVSQAGDLWLCGPHRVLCGDAASGEAVARLVGGRRVRLLVTEVPDGVESDSEWRDCMDVIVQRWQMLTGKQATLDGDGRGFEEVARERRMALRAAQGRKGRRRTKSSGSQAKACATILPNPTARN